MNNLTGSEGHIYADYWPFIGRNFELDSVTRHLLLNGIDFGLEPDSYPLAYSDKYNTLFYTKQPFNKSIQLQQFPTVSSNESITMIRTHKNSVLYRKDRERSRDITNRKIVQIHDAECSDIYLFILATTHTGPSILKYDLDKSKFVQTYELTVFSNRSSLAKIYNTKKKEYDICYTEGGVIYYLSSKGKKNLINPIKSNFTFDVLTNSTSVIANISSNDKCNIAFDKMNRTLLAIRLSGEELIVKNMNVKLPDEFTDVSSLCAMHSSSKNLGYKGNHISVSSLYASTSKGSMYILPLERKNAEITLFTGSGTKNINSGQITRLPLSEIAIPKIDVLFPCYRHSLVFGTPKTSWWALTSPSEAYVLANAIQPMPSNLKNNSNIS